MEATMERVLARVGEMRPGAPTLVVVAGLHGNEPAGVEASQRVARALAGRADRLRGAVVFVAGNLQALALGRRFVDRDLNRAWTPDEVEALQAGRGPLGVPGAAGAEDVEQRELLAVLDRVMDEAGGAVYVLDLHTTSGSGGPFSTVSDTLRNRGLAMSLPVPLVLGLEELVEGTLHEYLGTRGCISVAFESGQHAEPEAVDRAEAGIWILLAATGLVGESELPELAAARKRLSRDATHLPRVVEMRYRHAIAPEDAFRMDPGYRNFQVVERDQAVAVDRDGPVRVPESGRILMPLYQALGQDGFFVVREFSSFWLAASRVLRGMGLGRWVHWLPGIQLHPTRPDALVVDRRVARFYALQVLHLLGYRRHFEEGSVLVVIRQDHRPRPRRQRPAVCGRYSLATPLDDLVEVFEVDHTVFENWAPRFNVAPTQELPVLLRSPEGERRLGPMKWGLVPFWADDPSIGNRMINARSESAASKPAFREAYRRRRCVVPMDGFYEWRARAAEGGGKPRKVPFWIHRPDRRPFGVAGLWERWRGEEGAPPLVTFTILTTAASRWMRPLHDRMPAVLDEEGVARWLDPAAEADALGALLRPAPDDALEAWEVSPAVNRPANDDPALVEPVPGGATVAAGELVEPGALDS